MLTCASLLDDSKEHLVAEVTAGGGHVTTRLKVVGVVEALGLRLCYVLSLSGEKKLML